MKGLLRGEQAQRQTLPNRLGQPAEPQAWELTASHLLTAKKRRWQRRRMRAGFSSCSRCSSAVSSLQGGAACVEEGGVGARNAGTTSRQRFQARPGSSCCRASWPIPHRSRHYWAILPPQTYCITCCFSPALQLCVVQEVHRGVHRLQQAVHLEAQAVLACTGLTCKVLGTGLGRQDTRVRPAPCVSLVQATREPELRLSCDHLGLHTHLLRWGPGCRG